MKKKLLIYTLSLFVMLLSFNGCSSDKKPMPPLPTAEALDLGDKLSTPDASSDNVTAPNDGSDDVTASGDGSDASDSNTVSDTDLDGSDGNTPSDTDSDGSDGNTPSDTDSDGSDGNTPSDTDSEPTVKKFLSDKELTNQLSTIISHLNDWAQYSEVEIWEYMITDLDFNGRLEVIAATCSGSGLYTTAYVYEVTPDFTGLKKCPDNLKEGYDFTDIQVSTTNLFFDEDAGCYRYMFTNLARSGVSESYESQDTLSLKNGEIQITTVATISSIADELGLLSRTYKDSEEKEITEEQYYTAINAYYPHLNDLNSCSFEWFRLEGDGLSTKLEHSYLTFIQKLK